MTKIQLFMSIWNNYLAKRYDKYSCEYTPEDRIIIQSLDKDQQWISGMLLTKVVNICQGIDLDFNPYPYFRNQPTIEIS